MPAQTSVYQLPYPLPGDPPDGAAQIQALAEAVESRLVAQLQHIGAHGTWTRKSSWSTSSATYVNMSGANLSEGPTGTGYQGDASGLKVPFDGVYMMMGQIRIEGPSTSERIEVQIRQGPLGSETTVSTEQIRRDAGAGSIGFTIVGRASVMDAGDYVRLYIKPITSGSIQLSEARVQAFYLGNNAQPTAAAVGATAWQGQP